jgi:hypothetical protein
LRRYEDRQRIGKLGHLTVAARDAHGIRAGWRQREIEG